MLNKYQFSRDSKPVNHFKGYEVKYYGATNTKGARVKLTELRNGASKFISYDYALDSIAEMGINYLNSIGIKTYGFLTTSNGYVIITNEFDKTLSNKKVIRTSGYYKK